MKYQNYQESRDLAWKILLDFGFDELPIKVSEVCKKLGIQIRSYGRSEPFLKKYHLQYKTQETDGFTFSVDGQYIILFNEHCSAQRNRFTVAHELGHILLGHIPETGSHVTTVNREPEPKDDPIEQQANVFASRLLAPAGVLHEIGVNSAGQIAELCDMSLKASQFRLERLHKLYVREQRFLQEKGKSCFGLSPLERKVLDQFRSYIESHRL